MLVRGVHCTVLWQGLLLLILPTSLSDPSLVELKPGDKVLKSVRYILYDVNPGEGFNLRRDVYMRMAVMVKKLNKDNPQYYWILVLPPWGHLYHWQSRQLGHQIRIPWSSFFDVSSLDLYVPVMEFEDWIENTGGRMGAVYYLQGYKEGWKDGKFEEKFDLRDCIEKPRYHENHRGLWQGQFFYFDEVTADTFACLSVQGHTSVLSDWLVEQFNTTESIMLDRAENLLHDWFGDVEYWGARRSMRFAPHLVERANKFRQEEFIRGDKLDNTVLALDWREDIEQPRNYKGGDYACIHLRRGDYARGRGSSVASVGGAAKQIKAKMKERKLKKLFVATDAGDKEWEEFEEKMGYKIELFRYWPTEDELEKYKDGGVAIIDQLVCSRAQYFLGSKDSTFSFRIQEEREILNYPLKDTFDMLCPDQGECEKGSRWKIEWGEKGHKYEKATQWREGPTVSNKEEL